MKTIAGITIEVITGLYLLSTAANAQAPSSIAGDGILTKISSGTYPLASYGYAIFLPASTGNSYQMIGIYNTANNVGTYSYSNTAPSTGQVILNDTTDQITDEVAFYFSGATDGTYEVATISPPGYYQSGTFRGVMGTAPASLAGKTIICTIEDGLSPFLSAGTFRLMTAASGNGYTKSVDGGVGNSSGTYSYSIINRSTAKMQMSDSIAGSCAFYIGFADPFSGEYAITKQPLSSGHQVGTFLVTDTTPPTVNITVPTAGQRWSNSLFSVTGKASDNAQVTAVYYQLGDQDWELALTANSWTNWSANVTLTPGTNVVRAYGVDSTGNPSTTNTIRFQYVVTNQLRIGMTGLGTVSPNYSNAWLEIGRNYSITATQAAGFKMANWTISTNWIGGTMTNKSTVQFMMASNLTLQVNFADTNRPTLTISSPTAGRRMTNALANLIGTAGDNWKVTGVWYQLNGDSWNLVSTANNFTNWTKTVTLLAGTNTLKAYAQDLGGNFSLTNSLSVYSTNAFRLQLAFSNAPVKPDGLVFNLQMSPGLNGRILVSTNLVDWSALTNFVGTNSPLIFRDAAVTNHNNRFYRAVIP